ncbi:cytochrome P450 93B2-like [Andrographis paniculata]|uniref:cytochrome P450 93B2-like n=1 Tax=Andrographis paniculata TaxID=175694 RepID=UPI0021E7301F|nr:cytochrome P450 93B2-like [Andrographis paniculata]
MDLLRQIPSLPYTALLLLSAAVFLLLSRRRRHGPPPPPGPLALPVIGHLHLLSPRLHQTFHDLSLKYGPLMQLYLGSESCPVVSTPDLARDFLKTHELNFSNRKRSTAIKVITYDKSFAFSPYETYWKYINKLCMYELLGTRNIAHFQPVRDLEVRAFVQQLTKKGRAGAAVVNVTDELMKVTSNVISSMMLSLRAAEDDGDAEELRTLVREVSQIFGEFNVSDMFWFLKGFDLQGIRRRSEDIWRRYDILLERIISSREDERRAGGGAPGGEPRDFLDMLLDVRDGKCEVEFTRDHLKALVMDFLTAATDTTALTSEWAIAELINDSKILKKAQEEIGRVIGRGRLVNELDAPNLPYLQAIIKETLRLHPPIPLLPRKSVDDIVIHGYKIAANSVLFVNIWSIGRNPKYWENPLTFRPERFLENGNDSIDIKGQHFELLPFGTGRRGCPGMVMAIPELISIIGNMIQCFDWKLPNGESGPVDMSERPGLTLPRAKDLLCCVVPRVDPAIVFQSP